MNRGRQSSVPGTPSFTLMTRLGALPLKSVAIDIDVVGPVAHANVRQVFLNGRSEPIEAVYIFALPADGAVHRFTVQHGGRQLQGRLLEREEARKFFQRVTRHNGLAALMEEERPDVFTLSVGLLDQLAEVSVEFGVSWPLEVRDDELTLRFPLVVAPRHAEGAPLPRKPVGCGTSPDTTLVSDASRVTPPMLLPGIRPNTRVHVRVRIDPCGHEIEGLHAPLTTFSSMPQDKDGCVELVFPHDLALDRDLLVRYRLKGLQACARVIPDPAGDEGTFVVLFKPPTGSGTARDGTKRDVIFFVDASASMDGWKLAAARRLTQQLLDSLSPNDRFALLTYNASLRGFCGASAAARVPAWLEATPSNVARARDWLDDLPAEGETNLVAALVGAVALAFDRRPDAIPTVVLITDGQVAAEYSVLNAACNLGVRIFVALVDTAPNVGLGRQIAQHSGGLVQVIERPQRVDEVARSLATALSHGLVTDVRLLWSRLLPDLSSYVPQLPTTAVAGETLVILGRYEALDKQPALTISYTDVSGHHQSVPVPVTVGPRGPMRAAWARAMIAWLERQYRSCPTPELERTILRLSVREQVLSRFSAWLAAEANRPSQKPRQRRKVVQPANPTFGWPPASRLFVSRMVAERVRDADILTFSHFEPTDMPEPREDVLETITNCLAGIAESGSPASLGLFVAQLATLAGQCSFRCSQGELRRQVERSLLEAKRAAALGDVDSTKRALARTIVLFLVLWRDD